MVAHATRRGLTAACTAVVLAAALAGCTTDAAAPFTPQPTVHAASPPVRGAAQRVPHLAHVVIVVEENKGTDQVADLPFLGSLAGGGATFSDFRAATHPSEPNYLDLWSGSTHGLQSDACPVDLGAAPSLGSQLLGAGRTVAGYSEDLPSAGSTACSAGAYARKHNPLADFTATRGAAHNLPFSAFPHEYDRLPSVAFIDPNLNDDMHDGTAAAGDDWLRLHLAGYASWAPDHDSLLVVTFDENDGSVGNRIYTTLYGAHLQPGTYPEPADHDRLLHTIEASFGLPQLGASAAPITDIWG